MKCTGISKCMLESVLDKYLVINLFNNVYYYYYCCCCCYFQALEAKKNSKSFKTYYDWADW